MINSGIMSSSSIRYSHLRWCACLRDTLPQQWHHVKPSQESWACANEYRISNKPEASTVDWTATASGELEALRVDLRQCSRRLSKRVSIDCVNRRLLNWLINDQASDVPIGHLIDQDD